MTQINIFPEGEGPLTASEFLKGARIRKTLIGDGIWDAQVVISNNIHEITKPKKLPNINWINILSASPVLDIPECEFLVWDQINIDLTKFTYWVNIGFMDKYTIIWKLPEGLYLSWNIIEWKVQEPWDYELCVIANDKNWLQSNICNFTLKVSESSDNIQ